MPVQDAHLLDELFVALGKYLRVRERALTKAGHYNRDTADPATFRTLIALKHRPMRLSELAEAVFSDPSTVSRQVSHLVDEGLVRREADPDDGRATRLVVTEAGYTKLADLVAVRRRVASDMLSDWTTDDLETFVSLLKRFVTAAESQLPTAIAEGER
ncbi:MAG: MarR family transcriptional regulator [Gordonia sp. (in: high G+C Gram-positive bacteria)]|uniref:MarR family winged helix-turn-helix transcriptional regulator n=1 Tax=Gordonia sp. (in: high G+C Gram-positive bacteria) TaxID=84139 RepID=UPI0039E6656B